MQTTSIWEGTGWNIHSWELQRADRNSTLTARIVYEILTWGSSATREGTVPDIWFHCFCLCDDCVIPCIQCMRRTKYLHHTGNSRNKPQKETSVATTTPSAWQDKPVCHCETVYFYRFESTPLTEYKTESIPMLQISGTLISSSCVSPVHTTHRSSQASMQNKHRISRQAGYWEGAIRPIIVSWHFSADIPKFV